MDILHDNDMHKSNLSKYKQIYLHLVMTNLNKDYIITFGVIVAFCFSACSADLDNSNQSQNSNSSWSGPPSVEDVEVAESYQISIDRLAEVPSIQQAMQFIGDYDEQTIKNQIDLTELEAPPFKEHKFGRGKRFAELLSENGADSVWIEDRKSTRLNSSHVAISYAVF